MGEKDISKMNLGQLIAELNSTRDSIKSSFKIKDGDPNAEKIMSKRDELIKYEKNIYAQLDKLGDQYNSPKPERVFRE